jgi:hypothetical protein
MTAYAQICNKKSGKGWDILRVVLCLQESREMNGILCGAFERIY